MGKTDYALGLTHNIEYIVVRGREKNIFTIQGETTLAQSCNVSVYEYVGQLMMHVQDTTLKRRTIHHEICRYCF